MDKKRVNQRFDFGHLFLGFCASPWVKNRIVSETPYLQPTRFLNPLTPSPSPPKKGRGEP